MKNCISHRAFSIIVLAGLTAMATGLPSVLHGDTPAAADAPTTTPSSTPADVFKAKSLTNTDSRLVLPVETDIHDAVKAIRVAQAKQAVETKQRAIADGEVKNARAYVARCNSEYESLNAKLSTLSDPGQQNQVIGRINAIVTETKKAQASLDVLVEKKNALTTAREAYLDLIVGLADKAETARHAYDDLPTDEDLTTAITQANTTAKTKIKLGPSPEFVKDIAYVQKCRSEISLEVVSVSTEHGVPEVEATLNGKMKKTMVWDSGATLVTISSAMADELGMHPGDKDPTIHMKLADGRVIEAKQMVLKSVQVGAFIVNDVDCCVMPANLSELDSMLGDTFQSHFLCKLDQNVGQLRLTPLDAPSTKKGMSRPAAVKPTDKN